MLLFSLVLLFYPIAVFAEDICKVSPFKKCPKPFEGNFLSFLSDAELKDVCPKVLTYVDCLGNNDATCGDQVPRKVFREEGEYESVRAVIVDVCDETTLIHAVLIESVPCLKSGIFDDGNNTCYGEKSEMVQAMNILESEKGSYDYEGSHSSSERCLLHWYDAMCYVEYVEKSCGTLVKDAVIEVLDRSFVLREGCHPDDAAEFAEDVGKITKMRDSLKDILREFAKQLLKKKDIVLPA